MQTLNRNELSVLDKWTRLDQHVNVSALHTMFRATPKQAKTIPAFVLQHGLTKVANYEHKFPLTYAFTGESISVVQPYLTKEQLIKQPSKEVICDTPLHDAVSRALLFIAQAGNQKDHKLAKAGEDILKGIWFSIDKETLMVVGDKNQTVLHKFAGGGIERVIHLADSKMMHTTDAKNMTPLLLAAQCNQLEHAAKFIENSDLMPLMDICSGNNMQGLELLKPKVTKELWDDNMLQKVLRNITRFRRESDLLGIEIPEVASQQLGEDWMRKNKETLVARQRLVTPENTDNEIDIF